MWHLCEFHFVALFNFCSDFSLSKLPSKFSCFNFICYVGQLIFSYCDRKANSQYKAKQSQNNRCLHFDLLVGTSLLNCKKPQSSLLLCIRFWVISKLIFRSGPHITLYLIMKCTPLKICKK